MRPPRIARAISPTTSLDPGPYTVAGRSTTASGRPFADTRRTSSSASSLVWAYQLLKPLGNHDSETPLPPGGPYTSVLEMCTNLATPACAAASSRLRVPVTFAALISATVAQSETSAAQWTTRPQPPTAAASEDVSVRSP